MPVWKTLELFLYFYGWGVLLIIGGGTALSVYISMTINQQFSIYNRTRVFFELFIWWVITAFYIPIILFCACLYLSFVYIKRGLIGLTT